MNYCAYCSSRCWPTIIFASWVARSFSRLLSRQLRVRLSRWAHPYSQQSAMSALWQELLRGAYLRAHFLLPALHSLLYWYFDCYRCWVCVTRLVIEFLLVDQQNSVKLFASDSVVRCSCDAPLMVVKALLACHFFWLLGWSKPNQIERDSRMENYGQSRKLLSWQCLFSDLVIEKTIAPCDFR